MGVRGIQMSHKLDVGTKLYLRTHEVISLHIVKSDTSSKQMYLQSFSPKKLLRCPKSQVLYNFFQLNKEKTLTFLLCSE